MWLFRHDSNRWRWCSVTAIPRGDAITEVPKIALEAYRPATAKQLARKVNEGLRLRPEARFVRVDERDRRALNTSASDLGNQSSGYQQRTVV